MSENKGVLTKGRMAILIIIAILLVDQVLKIWVKTHMTLHETITITDWFKICFIENNGMAYGMEIGSKVALSLFRIAAISFIGYYLYLQVRQHARTGYVVCLAMIMAGAIGNIIDCMFYGLIFNASSVDYTSYFVPFGSGYASSLPERWSTCLFSADSFHVAAVDADGWWRGFRVFQPRVQRCRRKHQRGGGMVAPVLSP